MNRPPRGQSSQNYNPKPWRVFASLALVAVIIILSYGLFTGSNNIIAITSIITFILAIYEISLLRRFIVLGLIDFLKFLENVIGDLKRVILFLSKYPKDAFDYLRKHLVPTLVLVLVLVIVGAMAFLVFLSPQWVVSDPFNPIPAQNNFIGISMGGTVFDTDRINRQYKTKAATSYQNKDYSHAKSYWDIAIREDQRDAEAAIYREDLLVQLSEKPYITVVVLVSLSGDDQATLTGRSILQGAYIAQAEYNGHLPIHSDLPGHNDPDHRLPKNYLLRLIIANVSSSPYTDTRVAQRIIQIQNNKEENVVGVTGQFTNQDAVIQELQKAKIPMLSSTQLAGDIVGTPYLLSGAPSPEQEGKAAADYACSITRDHVAIFYDPSNRQSNQLTQAFRSELNSGDCNGNFAQEKQYTLGNRELLKELVQSVLSADDDLKLIYLPGASADDAKTLLSLTRDSNKDNHPQIVGDNTFYQFVHAAGPSKDFAGISYTAFAFHFYGEGKQPEKALLLRDYPAIFDIQKQHQGSLYGIRIPDANAILAYDVTDMLTKESGKLLQNEQTVSLSALWNRLDTIDRFQGFSGCLSFDPDGQPRNKAVVVLTVRADGTNYPASRQGQYDC